MSARSGSARAFSPPSVDDRTELLSWYFHDWANSAFSTTVVTVFLGPYLTSIAKAAADANGFVHPLGISVFADSFFPYISSSQFGWGSKKRDRHDHPACCSMARLSRETKV